MRTLVTVAAVMPGAVPAVVPAAATTMVAVPAAMIVVTMIAARPAA